jgi:hypothetical protein
MNERDSRTIRRLASIKAAIGHKAMTAIDIAKAIHINEVSAQSYMHHLLDEANQRVHIERWDRAPGKIIAVYRWGKGLNAPRPQVLTPVELERARINRIRRDPQLNAFRLARNRAVYRAKLATKTPQNWLSALM